MKQDDLKHVDIAYTKCFSVATENDLTIEFKDENLLDMYMHNFLYIKDAIETDTFKELLSQWTNKRKAEGYSFLRLEFDADLNDDWHKLLPEKKDISSYHYMYIKPEEYITFKNNDLCLIKKATSQELLADGKTADIEANKDEMGLDFVTRRYDRKALVYAENPNLFLYVCYLNGQPVGKCEMFIHHGIAKIEDFDVVKAYQRQGLGTSILKHLLHEAFKANIEHAYLMVEHDNTAIDMYKKCGFRKVGLKSEIIIGL